jgi:hypothetical protein
METATMTIGPGRYDDLCTLVRERADAPCVLIMVIGGKRGDGFSCQVADLQMMEHLPGLLEDIAAQIRKDQVS